MTLKEVILPAMGEGITDATIIRWLVKEGEVVEADQPMVEIATDKVDSEIPAPIGGKVKKILALSGIIAQVGETIAVIEVYGVDDENDEDDNDIEDLIEETINLPKYEPLIKESKRKPAIEKEFVEDYSELPFVPPYIRLVAQKLNIDLFELAQFSAIGKGGSLRKHHVEEYLRQREYSVEQIEIKPVKPLESIEKPMPVSQIKETYSGNYEVSEMSRMRKIIAQRMVASSQVIPHVTSFIEVDITNIVLWRERVKEDFFKKYNVKLTYTPIFVEAIVAALKQYPEVNVSLDGDTIILKKDINIGMATVLPDRNLIVPVIKDADSLSLSGIAQSVSELADNARNNSLKPTDITGSTFTFTNIGVFGSLTGTPLINMPESAILGIGAINKKPFVVKSSEGNFIGIRDIVMLSLAYDHRIIDGSLGGLFLKAIADFLVDFKLNREV